jgi:hypothetical protein
MRKSCFVFLTLPDQAIQAHCDTLGKVGFTGILLSSPSPQALFGWFNCQQTLVNSSHK